MDALEILGGTTSLYEDTIKENLAERKIILNEDVTADVVESIILQIIKYNKEDKGLPSENRKPIRLYINSGGGEVLSGFGVVSAIEGSITPVHGICLGYAASMSYNILISCHKRFAFPNSVLLQHDGEIGVQNSSTKAKQTMKFFDEMEERTKRHVLKYTNMTQEFYDEIHDQEYWMYADTKGKELGCIDKIIGEDCTIDDIL